MVVWQKGGLRVHGGQFFRRGGHADLELRALGLADGIARRAGFAQHIEPQHITLPGKKRVPRGVFDLAPAHAFMPGRTG